MRHQVAAAGRRGRRAVHCEPHHQRHREGVRRLRVVGHRHGGQPQDSRDQLRHRASSTLRMSSRRRPGSILRCRSAHSALKDADGPRLRQGDPVMGSHRDKKGSRGQMARKRRTAHSPGHGWWWNGSLHRLCPPRRRPHRRGLRAGRRRIVVAAGRRDRVRQEYRPRRGPHLHLLRGDGGQANRRARTASRRWRSSRRTTCTMARPRPSSRPASTSSATSR